MCSHILNSEVSDELMTLLPDGAKLLGRTEARPDLIQACLDALTMLSQQIKTLHDRLDIAARKHFSERNSYERLEFMRGTITLLQGYVVEQMGRGTWTTMRDCWCYLPLILNITNQVSETLQMLDELLAGRFTITVNFDIFELAMRKYYEEITVMFPSVCESPAEADLDVIIHDKDALECWQTHFGEGLRIVSYDMFVDRVVRQHWPQELINERFMGHLAHFFNFPRDNFFTAYRFNLLVSLFGPFESVATNFTKYVLCPGFLGLINMLKAEEILTQLLPQLRRSTVLMRFSRRKPDLFAFSSIDVRTGKVEHRRNVNKIGQSVPIGQYLARAFPGYDLVLMGVDDIATKCANTFIFAHGGTPYIYSFYS